MEDVYGLGSMRGCLTRLIELGQVVEVPDRVLIEYEMMKYVRASADRSIPIGPGFLFRSPYSAQRQGGELKLREFQAWVVAGMYGSEERLANILEWATGAARIEAKNNWRVFDACVKAGLSKLAGSRPIPYPVDGTVADAYPHRLSLSDLPINCHNERDGGYFITGGVQVVYDPEFECYVSGIHRMKVVDREGGILGCLATGERRVGRAIMKWHDRGLPAPVVTLLGAAPRDVLASQAKVPHDVDKYVLGVGFSQSRPPALCAWYGDGAGRMLIPSDSEVVVLGFVPPPLEGLPNRLNDNPFGEFPGTYSSNDEHAAWRVEVAEVRARLPLPIYQTMTTGLPVLEDHVLCGVANVPYLYDIVKRACSEVVDVSLGREGNYVFDVFVSIKKRMSGEARNVILAALSTVTIKSVWVFDHDIDVHDPRDRQFAWNTRFQPATDTIIIGQPVVGSSLDPSCSVFRHTTKIGFDCTYPLGQVEKFEKATFPAEDLDQYWSHIQTLRGQKKEAEK